MCEMRGYFNLNYNLNIKIQNFEYLYRKKSKIL